MTDNISKQEAPSGPSARNQPVGDPRASSAASPKLPPCDQCRRRKVKCDGVESCSRCRSSQLTCTREIARKKRGPKKGSGSVIARLRDEHQQNSSQEAILPPFDLSQLELQIPSLHSDFSNSSPLGSPLTSPIGSQFADVLGPTSGPPPVPRSVPSTVHNGSEISPDAHTAFAQRGIQFPAAWQMQSLEILQFQTPVSPGYLSVNDLAQQIFHDGATAGSTILPPRPRHPTTSPGTSTPITGPASIGAVLTSTATGTVRSPAPAPTTTSSPMTLYGPKLYHGDSGSAGIESRISSLATEFGLSAYLMSQCVRQYFAYLYPTMPIIHEGSFMQRLTQTDELSIEDKILVLSLCAVTVLHAAPQSDVTLDKKWQLGRQFLDLCFHIRRTCDWIESASLASIQASYYICVSMFELKKPRTHYFYLREAISMAHEQGLHLEATYVGMAEIQAICSRRTFTLLFITERGLTILRNKPTAITRLPYLLSDYFEDQDAIVLTGFSSLVNLFSILDDKFVDLWSSTPGDVSSAEPLSNIAAIQHSLNEMSFDNTAMTDTQKADVLITHQWLRLIFWQASMRQGLISYAASDPIFSSSYPITIAKDLCVVMNQLSIDAVLVHGLGIFEKLFEVAYTLMDALTIASFNWSDSEELRYLFSCLSASPNSHSTYVKMLENKMDTGRSPQHSPGLSGG